MDTEDHDCDEQLTIVLREREYCVSKKYICSRVPYFEKMFCCDLLESKENKVELDFDERVFTSILNWIHSESCTIQMDFVIRLCDAADYLMINDRLFKTCFTYFHGNFTIEHIPVVLPQVTKVSKLINSEAINNLICRHFLTIANTKIFLDFPVETIEAILKLDLMVHSEYQILESIYKWLSHNSGNLENLKSIVYRLFDCVRWSLLNSKDKKLILNGFDVNCIKGFSMKKSLPYLLSNLFWDLFRLHDIFEAKLDLLIENVSYEEYEFHRNKQNFFISIQQKNDENIRINIFDNKLCCSPIGDFTRDDSMSLEFVHGENISDVLFDSGTKGIRIDWIKKTFRWLDFKVKGKTYYSQLMKFIVNYSNFVDYFGCYLEDRNTKLPSKLPVEEKILIESDGEFILIGRARDGNKWFGLFAAIHPKYFNNYEYHKRSFQATVLDNVVYILTKDLEFIRFDIKTRSFEKRELFNDKLDFDDLILTSHAKNDNKVILVGKSSGKVHFYCTNENQWLEKCRIMNVNFFSNNLNVNSYKLIGFTSTFLPMKVIKPLYDRKVLSSQ